MNNQVSINELARQAGVSPTTVSIVLNDRPLAVRLSPSTREKVRMLAKKLNYHPNHLAKAMVTQMTQTLGFICGGIGSTPYYSELMESLTWTAESHGYQLLLKETRWDKKKEMEALEMLLSRALDGILIFSRIFENESSRILQMCGEHAPLVVLGISDLPDFSSVCFDFGSGMRELFSRLVRHGVHDIAIADDRTLGIPRPQDAKTPLALRQYTLKHTAYAAACREYGITPRYFDFLFQSSATVQDCIAQILKEPPQVLITSSDLFAARVISSAGRVGLRVPEDFSVISLDGTQFFQLYNPPLTSIRQDVTLMAEAGIQELIRLIHERNGCQNIILPTTLCMGESVKKEWLQESG